MMILTKRFCDPPNLSPIGFCGVKSGFLRCESMVFRGCTCVYCNLFAALLQTVSSCRGPIYRARIYVNTHVIGRGNACAVK